MKKLAILAFLLSVCLPKSASAGIFFTNHDWERTAIVEVKVSVYEWGSIHWYNAWLWGSMWFYYDDSYNYTTIEHVPPGGILYLTDPPQTYDYQYNPITPPDEYIESMDYTATYYDLGSVTYEGSSGGGGDPEEPVYATPPSSQNAVIPVGVPWTPVMTGGANGTNMFHIVNYTNWDTDPWTPTQTGEYTFHVGKKTNPGAIGNAIDPIQGEMAVNFTVYTVIVE